MPPETAEIVSSKCRRKNADAVHHLAETFLTGSISLPALDRFAKEVDLDVYKDVLQPLVFGVLVRLGMSPAGAETLSAKFTVQKRDAASNFARGLFTGTMSLK